jgi:catechol 2,3-dioxygenase-like lactoylglutathione lyase family enzyme
MVQLVQEGTMLKIGSIVWGVRDVPRAIEFWCAALNYRPLREASADWAILIPSYGDGQRLAITIVSSAPKAINVTIWIFYASDQQTEVERLLTLGARRVTWRYPEGADYVVLADPDGNTFCVVQK